MDTSWKPNIFWETSPELTLKMVLESTAAKSTDGVKKMRDCVIRYLDSPHTIMLERNNEEENLRHEEICK